MNLDAVKTLLVRFFATPNGERQAQCKAVYDGICKVAGWSPEGGKGHTIAYHGMLYVFWPDRYCCYGRSRT